MCTRPRVAWAEWTCNENRKVQNARSNDPRFRATLEAPRKRGFFLVGRWCRVFGYSVIAHGAGNNRITENPAPCILKG
jgi:hypothetical protein